MKPNTALALVLSFFVFVVLVATFAGAANQGYVSPDQAVAGDAPCDLTGVVPAIVPVTATTAATSSVMGKGKVRVLCSSRSFMVVGAVGVTGVTAGTATGNAIAAGVPEEFWSRGSMFAFIRDTADGRCDVSQCK